MVRQDVAVDAEGAILHAWWYPARGRQVGTASPCVVMAHGWTSTKKIYLDRFAEVFAESQANYIASAISYARAHSVTALEPTPDAQQDFAAKVDRLSDGTVWTSGGCRSWYLNATVATPICGRAALQLPDG